MTLREPPNGKNHSARCNERFVEAIDTAARNVEAEGSLHQQHDQASGKECPWTHDREGNNAHRRDYGTSDERVEQEPKNDWHRYENG